MPLADTDNNGNLVLRFRTVPAVIAKKRRWKIFIAVTALLLAIIQIPLIAYQWLYTPMPFDPILQCLIPSWMAFWAWLNLRVDFSYAVEVQLDSTAFRRRMPNGREEFYPWRNLIDIEAHALRPFLPTMLHFREKRPIPFGFGEGAPFAQEESEAAKLFLLDLVGVYTFLDKAQDLHRIPESRKKQWSNLAFVATLLLAVLNRNYKIAPESLSFTAVAIALLTLGYFMMREVSERRQRRQALFRRYFPEPS